MLFVAIFLKCKLYLPVLGHVLYAAIMLPKFYKITSLENKFFIQVFCKQHDLASHDSLVVGSIGCELCGVAGTSPTSRGGGVSQDLQINYCLEDSRISSIPDSM